MCLGFCVLCLFSLCQELLICFSRLLLLGALCFATVIAFFYHVTGAAGLKVECSQKCRRRRRRNGEGRIGLLCLSWPCACGSPRFVFCLGFFTHAPLSAALFQHFFTRRFEQGRGNMSEIDSWKKLGTH
jgi:hypothetical protein